jgi:hypothetical protein
MTRIANNFIYANTAPNGGAGVYLGAGNFEFWHNTLVANTSNLAQGAALRLERSSNADIRNNILWNNSGLSPLKEIFRERGLNATIFFPQSATNNIIQNAPSGSNNLNTNPLLLNPANGDLRIPLQSPARLAAAPVPLPNDFFHQPRRPAALLARDLGAHEFTDDSDGDGMPDAWELQYGLNPFLNDADGDPDGDGLTNLQEYQLGTNPLILNDGDGDGIPDAIESTLIGRTPAGGWFYLSPTNPDTDNNGIPDGQEDYDQDDLTVLEELALGTNPNLFDTDGDGVGDGMEVALGTNPLVADAWVGRDSDGDGIDDLTEIALGTDPSIQTPTAME